MKKTVPPTSKPLATQLLVDSLEKSWRKYRTELKRCREEFSREAVHDLRVATRRILAVMKLLHCLSPRPRLQKIMRSFKDQLDEFDDLRDTQVILAEISETIQELPGLESLQKRQRHEEDKYLRNVRKRIGKFNTKELSRRISKTHDSIRTAGGNDLETDILRAVDDAFTITKQRLEVVDLARPSTIHRVRIAFKNFRYTVEIVHPLLKGFPNTNLKYMQDYQSLMGEIQDAEVFLQTLNDHAEHGPFPDSDAVLQYYERREAEAISAFAKAMNLLYSFWRLTSDQPFPWEKPQ
jgi:CHAD domain-containing protein